MLGAVGGGCPESSFASAIPRIASEGWDGVVFALTVFEFDDSMGPIEELGELCAAHGLDLATMLHTFGADVDDQLSDLAARLDSVAAVAPHHIIVHGGRDAFDEAAAVRFLSEAVAMRADFRVPLAQETHRSRILFNPWVTARMLDAVDGIELALDLSHWVVVAERLIHDAVDIIHRVAGRAVYIDAPVGHEQGPQVPDSRDAEWAAHLSVFESWWNGAVATAGVSIDEVVIVPEYGPPPYQQTVGGRPTSDLWEVCDWAGRCLRDRYAAEITQA